VTPDGQRVVWASEDQTLHVWDLESRRSLAILEGHADSVRSCAVTPDGRCVVSASADRTLKVWDLKSGCALATLAGPSRFCAVSSSEIHENFIHDGSVWSYAPLDETCTSRPPRCLAVWAGYRDGLRGDGEPSGGIYGVSIMYENCPGYRRESIFTLRRSR
jgi:WD40 repeat protein